jgi:multidrug efflux pump subunit AcrA (membrane-fusion protein)
MSAVADLLVRTAHNAVSVPSSAVVRDGSVDTVWLVTNGRAERREVKLGAQGEDAVQVLEGLEIGDQVVVRGADRVSAGQSVS